MSAAQSTARVAVSERSVATMMRLISNLPLEPATQDTECAVGRLRPPAGVTQLAEQRFRKPQVGGSSPPSGSTNGLRGPSRRPLSAFGLQSRSAPTLEV